MNNIKMKLTAAALAAVGLVGTMGMTGATAAEGLPFTDVAENAWYQPFVAYTYEEGLFAGTSATTFSPEREITRGELVTVIGKMHALRTGEAVTGGTATFSDVKAKQYYAPYVAWAQERGVVAGYGDGSFHPGEAITREMAATIMNNYITNYELTLEGTSEKRSDYLDADGIATWAQSAVANLTAYGVMSGDDMGRFNPKKITTRAEAATILTNLYQDVTNPTETDVSYQAIRYAYGEEDYFQFRVLDEPYAVITDYDEYSALVEKALAYSKDTEAFTPLTEAYFASGTVVAVELQCVGTPAYRTKLTAYEEALTTGAVIADIDLTFFSSTGTSSDFVGATADTVGYLYLIEVPRYEEYSVVVKEVWKVNG